VISFFQILLSAGILTFSAWLSKRNPEAAGFLIALPLASILVLPFSYWQHQDAEASVKLGQEILRAVPISMTFFVPFALAGRLHLGFWQAYALGLLAIIATYLLMRFVQTMA